MRKRDYLGILELMVLPAILQAGEDAYSVPIAREIEDRIELARKSKKGGQIVVTDSGHTIPYEAPQAVIDAVREVVAGTRHAHLVG